MYKQNTYQTLNFSSQIKHQQNTYKTLNFSQGKKTNKKQEEWRVYVNT